jgi:hypothetical protein
VLIIQMFESSSKISWVVFIVSFSFLPLMAVN